MVEKQKAVVENGVQKIRITAEKGYSPKEFQLQKGIPAEITFHRVNPRQKQGTLSFHVE